MKRIKTLTFAAIAGAALAVLNLITGTGIRFEVIGPIVGFGLFFGAIALCAVMLAAGLKDRKLPPADGDGSRLLAGSARRLRWNALFAVGVCVLLFANCSGGIGTAGPVVHTSGPLAAPGDFLWLTAVLLLPLLVVLSLPAILVSRADAVAASRPRAARTLAQLAVWASVGGIFVALGTAYAGFVLGISACYFGSSAGLCAAGAGGLTNVLSAGAVALSLPYVGLALTAISRLGATSERV